MKAIKHFVPPHYLRTLAAACLVATLSAAPVLAFAANANANGNANASASADAHADRAELRIKTMHTKLKITAAQEESWGKVAEVMRDDGKRMDALTQARADHANQANALDDLKSYSEVTDAHADGIRKLAAAFGPLYTSMSDTQKKEADELFRHGDGRRAGMQKMMKSN